MYDDIMLILNCYDRKAVDLQDNIPVESEIVK